MYELKFNRFIYARPEVGKLSLKDKTVNIVGSVGLQVSIETTQVCYYSPQQLCVMSKAVFSTIFYTTGGQMWPLGHGLPIPASFRPVALTLEHVSESLGGLDKTQLFRSHLQSF